MSILKRIGLIIFVTIVGTFVSWEWAVLSDNGYLEKWKFIGIVTSQVTQIISPYSFRTTDGVIYQIDAYCDANCLTKANSPTDVSYLRFLPIADCGRLPKTNRFQIYEVFCTDYGPGGPFTHILAVNKQGGVYLWEHNKGESGAILLVVAPFTGFICSFVLGIFVLGLEWIIKRKKKKILGT
jgi:hypothetical protein